MMGILRNKHMPLWVRSPVSLLRNCNKNGIACYSIMTDKYGLIAEWRVCYATMMDMYGLTVATKPHDRTFILKG